MLVFPNAKINLGLNVVSKREDGYHNIESCFYPIMWQDALEIIESEKFSFTSSGLEISGNIEDNLCVKAYQLIKSQFDIPNVKIHLHKNIPMGAGLGGGSSDAAFVLKLLIEKFQLQISNEELIALASKLGADCAFFIHNKPMYATQKGEVMDELDFSLKGYYIFVVHPHIHVNTALAYKGIVPSLPKQNCKDVLFSNIKNWKENLKNDFEKSVFENHPVLNDIKQKFYQEGAIYASMSGSGSAIYGIFENEISLDFDSQYSIYRAYL